MKLLEHGFTADGQVQLTFENGLTASLSAEQISVIAQQHRQFLSSRDNGRNGYVARTIQFPKSFQAGTTDENKLALIIDQGSELEFVLGMEPELALQLSDLLREQALQLISSPSPRKN